jgi:phenylpropionate dioxygenase-like ring-hydroxylating dioxygenase large terminal subunit
MVRKLDLGAIMAATTNHPYDEIRRSYHKLKTELRDPESFRLNPQAPTDAADAKSPPLQELYPNVDQFRVISTDRYLSPEVMEREWHRLWTRTWLLAGRASDLAKVGDWFKFDIGRESIIVVRNKSDQISALYNACRHRGNQLVREDFGSSSNFVCSFHGWAYALNGRNLKVTDRDTFAEGALCEDLDLGRIHTHVWAGFVFVNMAEHPVPFESYLADIAPIMAPYRMEEMRVVKDVQLTMPANWKAALDAFQEIYHMHQTHPQAMPFCEDHFCQYDFYPNGHNRLIAPNAMRAERLPSLTEVDENLGWFLQDAGIDPTSFKGSPQDVRAAVIAARRAADNVLGLDMSEFSDSGVLDDWNVTLFPHVTFNAHPEGVLVMRFRPHPSDPQQFIFDATILMPQLKPPKRAPGYMGLEPDIDLSDPARAPRRYTTLTHSQLGEFLEQDLGNIPFVQKGLNSRGIGGVVRFSEQERRLQQFYAELDRFMEAPNPSVSHPKSARVAPVVESAR